MRGSRQFSSWFLAKTAFPIGLATSRLFHDHLKWAIRHNPRHPVLSSTNIQRQSETCL